MGRSQMVRQPIAIPIGKQFEPAKALQRAVLMLAWKRRAWTVLTVVALLETTVAVFALTTAVIFAEHLRLSPHTLLWLLHASLGVPFIATVTIFAAAVSWLLRERFHHVIAEADKTLGVGDSLRNALDLAKLREDEQFVSPLFAKAAITQAWQQWQTAAQNGAVLSLTCLHRRRAALAWSIAALSGIGSFIIWQWLGVSVLALLSLYHEAKAVLEFERHGRLQVRIDDADGIVLKGSRVRASVQAFNGKATMVRLCWQTDSGIRWLPTEPIGKNRFAATVTVSENGTLQAVCGKVKSKSVRLRAVLPPRVTEWLISLEPPAYTELPTDTFMTDEPQPLSVLKGTAVSITVTTSAPLQNAQCVMSNGLMSNGSMSNEQWMVETSERTAQIRFVAMRPVRWRLRLFDRYGFDGETGWHTVTVEPDEPPTVRVLLETGIAMAGGFMPLTIQAEDDFGVSALALQFGLGDAKRPPSQPRTAPLTIAPNRKVERSLMLPMPITAVGSHLWVRGIAKDNDEVSGAKTSLSPWLVVRIGTSEDIIGTPHDWLQRLRQLEVWMQKGNWQKVRQELAQWQKDWQEQIRQAQWTNQALPHQWLAQWLEHLQEHLQRGDMTTALRELWQMQQALERAIGEQRLAELAQEASALRAMQEAVSDTLRQNANPQSLTTTQKHIAQRTEWLRQGLQDEMKRWEQLGEANIAFMLLDAAKALERRPTTQAMEQAAAAMQQRQTDAARQRSDEALSDLREVEERLTSPTQSPLAQMYRQERNRLAQLIEQTERLRRDQAALRQQTEAKSRQRSAESETKQPSSPLHSAPRTPRSLLSPPPPPSWSEVEQLTPQQLFRSPSPAFRSLSPVERQRELRQRAEGLQRPLGDAMRTTPQISPQAPHHLQRAIEQMQQAEKELQKPESSGQKAETAATYQRQAEQALRQLAEVLRQALQMEQGTAAQRMGAGENEAMVLAQRQAQLLRQTQQLHQQRQQGQRPSPSQLQRMGAEEGNIRRALSRAEGFFGDALPSELRQRLGQAQEQLQWLEEQLPRGETGEPTQGRQQQVLETLLQLAQALSGQQQGNQQGQQQRQGQQGQQPTTPDINWGRFVEHGPPLLEIPEALQGKKGGAAFVERAKGSVVLPLQPIVIPRITVPPAYHDMVQRYQRLMR